jgi:hypothetical protein
MLFVGDACSRQAHDSANGAFGRHEIAVGFVEGLDRIADTLFALLLSGMIGRTALG